MKMTLRMKRWHPEVAESEEPLQTNSLNGVVIPFEPQITPVLHTKSAFEAGSVCLKYKFPRVSKGNRKQILQVAGNTSGLRAWAFSQGWPLCQMPQDHITGLGISGGQRETCVHRLKGFPQRDKKNHPARRGKKKKPIEAFLRHSKMSGPVTQGYEPKGRVESES